MPFPFRPPLLATAALLLLAHASPAHAEHRLSGALAGDASFGFNTRITVWGGSAALAWTWLPKRNGLEIEARDQWGIANGVGKHLPGAHLGWTHLWGEDDWRPYSTLGVSLAFIDLVPVLPIPTAEIGMEHVKDKSFLRVGAQGFYVPAPAAGGGPRISYGRRF
jgi:hypothetical protein